MTKELLEEQGGIPRSVLAMMAIVAGFTVANLYYNQPLLEMMRADLRTTVVAANLITVITQMGYAAGLCFVIPMGDLYSRRRIISISMLSGAAAAIIIALSHTVETVWGASFILGVCSVIPQLFIPIAGQFSRPENRARNMGYVLSGLLTGILSARVVSGFVGHWAGWRIMYLSAAILMLICLVVVRTMLPPMRRNYQGSYLALLRSVAHIFATNGTIRLYSVRAAFGFGSMLCIWSTLAFHLSEAPFYAGSEKVGMLGICGIASAVAASGLGKYVPRWGIFRFSAVGSIMQLAAWTVAWLWGDSYLGLVLTIILVDVGLQCQQLSNQSGCMAEAPNAANRVNTIFMTTFFIGGSLGTFAAGIGWEQAAWSGVCSVGMGFALISFLITLATRK